MYHYTDSGLDNVWLVNGFTEVETPYGIGVSIDNLEGLHLAIGHWLVTRPSPLTGAEFRFLRLEMDISQKSLGGLMASKEQNVGRWERGDVVIPGPADRLLRVLYADFTDGDEDARTIVGVLADLDEIEVNNLQLKETSEGWKVSA